jgi:hypothetical protein
MLIISTSRGSYNRFAKTYRAAKRGDSQFVPFFRSWEVSPFLQCNDLCGWCTGKRGNHTPCPTKYDAKRREFADEPWRFFQEYPRDDEEAFRESGRPRFQGLLSDSEYAELPYRGNLTWLNDDVLEFEFDENGPLRLSTLDEDKTAFYVIGADSASGQGRDYSAAQLLTIDDDGMPTIVGYYHSNVISPVEFAADLDKLGRYFKGRQWAALMAVENQGSQGSLPINELHRHLNYPNAYMHQSIGTKSKNRTRLFEFPMTTDRRKAVIDRLAKYLVYVENECQLKNIYPSLRTELGQFVTQETVNGNIRYAADTGCHDDLVMSMAIALWVLVEEGQVASPVPATTEDQSWRPTGQISLKSVREARQRAIAEMEQQQAEQWEAFQLGIDMSSRGYYG